VVVTTDGLIVKWISGNSGKGWVDRDPPVVKINVLSTRRKEELLLLLRRSRSSGTKTLPSSRRA
jgi:hypothetical protein